MGIESGSRAVIDSLIPLGDAVPDDEAERRLGMLRDDVIMRQLLCRDATINNHARHLALHATEWHMHRVLLALLVQLFNSKEQILAAYSDYVAKHSRPLVR